MDALTLQLIAAIGSVFAFVFSGITLKTVTDVAYKYGRFEGNVEKTLENHQGQLKRLWHKVDP